MPAIIEKNLPKITVIVKGHLPEATVGKAGEAKSFVEVAKSSGSKIQVPKGPTVRVQNTQTFVLAPKIGSVDKYPNYDKTREAAIGALRASQMRRKIENIRSAGKSSVRIEARSVDLDKVKALPALAEAGLEVKEDAKYNPRLILHGIPVAFSKDDIRADFIALNLDGANDEALRVVYVYPPKGNKAYTSCVVEVSHGTWASLKGENRIYIGHTACRFDNHVRVLQCFKCLAFGHLAKDCKSEARCGLCAGQHETRTCPVKDNTTGYSKCHNCLRAKLGDDKHSALDGKKCPLLINKLKDRISRTHYG